MRLADYSSDKHCFEFDPHTGACSRLTLPTPREGRGGYSGMGQLLRTPRRETVLVATYLLDGDPWFSIDAERWKLFDGTLTVRHRERCAGLLCELSLYRGATCIRRLRYLRRDWLALFLDPAYDHLDFSLAHLPVDLVPSALSSPDRQRADFIEMWSGDSRSTEPPRRP